MRLTAELIARAPSYLNPLKQRELDLRGIFLSAAGILARSAISVYLSVFCFF
jgi:hypothetical protein